MLENGNAPVGEQNEMEKLRSELEEQKKMIESLLAANQKQEKKPRQYNKKQQQPTSNYDVISPNYYVRVMSLVDNPLNLNTQSRGKGKSIRFEEFGQTERIFYSDLLDINRNHRNFLEAGYYIILDDKVVQDQGLEKLYEKILTKEKIEKILSNSEDALTLFESANDKQKNVVAEFLVSKVVANESVDYNLLREIQKVSSIDVIDRAKKIQENDPSNFEDK